ncbi:hypothetical protein F5Y03DRAFT_409179 [Xylaria venustula]|nr:hypothetical protein F5Y03DRAFT_409179 [Xylaria venustula]
MADSLPDFSFLDSSQDDPDYMLDDLFPGIDFSDNNVPGIEGGLEADFPVKEAEKICAPEPPTSSSLETEALNSSAAELINEMSLLQDELFIPQELTVDSQNTYAMANVLDTNTLDMGWLNNQQPLDPLLTNNISTAQTFNNQIYPQLFPMNTQFGLQPMFYPQQFPTQNEQICQMPMVPQMSAQPMYGPPIMHPPMNGQPMNPQQPVMVPQLNHPQMVYKQPMNTDYQSQGPWPPERTSTARHLQPRPHPMPSRPVAPVGSASPVSRNPSSVPPPIDRRRGHSQKPPSADTVTTSEPLKRPAHNHLGQPLLNDKIPRRTHGQRKLPAVDPERYYGPSPEAPKAWGPLNSNGEHLFTYTLKGELRAGFFLTHKEMRQYLCGPAQDRSDDFEAPARLPGVKRYKNKIRQGLTLWIGWPAPMANSRYPRGGESTKCRFKDCRYGRTISLGDPWVILDERQNAKGEIIDPFHNAGYVHLYCLEYHFDIIELWHLLDVRVDTRKFKRESHPYFSLEHKLPGIHKPFMEWYMATYEKWYELKVQGKKRVRDHETSLSETLVRFKLDNEPKSQATNRRKRGGADMSKHLGNPELKRKFQAYKKHGLLDERGFPIASAAAQLEEIENSPGKRRLSSPGWGFVSPPHHPVPVQNNAQQFLSYAHPVQPAYHTANPAYPNEAAIVQTSHPIQTLRTPFAPVTGQKRGRETDATIMPSPAKRQQLDGVPPAPAPTPPHHAPVVPANNTGVGMHGELLQSYSPTTADIPTDLNVNPDHDLGNLTKDPKPIPQPGLQTAPAVGNSEVATIINGPIVTNPLPLDNEQGSFSTPSSLNSLDFELFGKPESDAPTHTDEMNE